MPGVREAGKVKILVATERPPTHPIRRRSRGRGGGSPPLAARFKDPLPQLITWGPEVVGAPALFSRDRRAICPEWYMPLSWVTLGFLYTSSFWNLLSSEKLWEKSEKDHSRLCPWECLVFVQMWPSSFCVFLPSKYDCVMSEKPKNWTIHGLWPGNIQECCPYWRLFPSDLMNLVPELNHHWPTFTNLSNFQFWEKEWEKHGTCGGCSETLNSPKKFFGAALFLHAKYNIDRAFEKAGIIPSCLQSYQLSTFADALEPLLGPRYQLQCVTDRQGRELLVQIKASLFGNFSTGCGAEPPMGLSPYHPCRAQRGILYAPPNLEDPRHPCP